MGSQFGFPPPSGSSAAETDPVATAANAIGPTQLASTAVTPGTYGSATAVTQVTIDADGRATFAANVGISPNLLQGKVFDDATAVATGNGKLIVVIPPELNGFTLLDADAYVTTTSTQTNTLTSVQLRNATTGNNMLSTQITIDFNEFTSYTAATQPVIATTTASNRVSTGDLIAADVNVAGAGAKGLGVVMKFG